MEAITSRVYKPSDFSEGQWHEVLVTLARKGFSPEMAAEVANGKSGKAEEIVSLFLQTVDDFSFFISNWQSFYKDSRFFGMDVDFSNIRIPERKPGFDRLIMVAQGLTPNKVYSAGEKNFKCWRYTNDLDSDLDWEKEERNPTNGAYAIWVRDRGEADEELKNLSADDIDKKGIKTETLTERLLHSLKYWSETGEHLDKHNITLCSGSRCRGGGAPGVVWDGVDVHVRRCGPGHSHDYLRAREVVS